MVTHKRKIFIKPRVSKKQNASPKVNLKAFLARSGVAFEFLAKKPTKHATEASKVTGIPVKNFAKTLILVNELGKPFVAVLRADLQINRHLLQRLTGFKAIKTASIGLAEKVTGYPTGGIPPIGHKVKMPVFVDGKLLELAEVWCGGGSRSKLVKLQVNDILRLSNANVSSFAVAGEKQKG